MAGLSRPASEHDVKGSWGKGVGPNADPAKAVYWYERAAENGVPPAPLELARMYQHGSGVPADGRKAVYWYEHAYKRFKLRNAVQALIAIYRDGIPGVPKDGQKMEFWEKQLERQECPGGSLERCG